MKKSKLNITPEQLARLRITFALRRMTPELQSDVLADGTITARAGIEVSHPIKLPEDIIIDRRILFAAFQKAADGETVSEIADINGVTRNLEVEIDGESAFLVYGTHRIRFPCTALLSTKLQKRQAAAEAILKSNTLTTQSREDFKAIASKADFSHADYFAAMVILMGSPETFATTLRETANKGELAKANFLPSQIAHWENITARRALSRKLPDFIARELATERTERLARGPETAVDGLSLSFGGPELVPLDMMRQVDPDVLLAALRRLMDYADPFALVGAFHICADRAAGEARFVDLGEDILSRLLSDPTRLRNELTTFGAAFVIASAHLAEHETLRKEPVFWRRLAAASHASLVARVLGAGEVDEPSLLTWATHLAGKTFYLSVLNESYIEPRWRPDWISPNYLAADIYGRLLESLRHIGDAAPSSWLSKVADAETWITANTPPIAYAFPAMLQGGSVTPIERPDAGTSAARMYEKLVREPTIENFLVLMPVVYAFGFPPDAQKSILKVIQLLRAEIAVAQPEFAEAVLDLAAFIAARNRDTELADAVAVVAIERLLATLHVDRLLPTFSVLVQCAASVSDRKEAAENLARRLESVSFIAPSGLLAEALDNLRALQSINEDLEPLLARAVATARLGLPRIAAA